MGGYNDIESKVITNIPDGADANWKMIVLKKDGRQIKICNKSDYINQVDLRGDSGGKYGYRNYGKSTESIFEALMFLIEGAK
jgi:hypothetical protein